MVDDLTAGAIERMKAGGYTAAVVVETSPGNFQAWLNHGQVLSQRLSTLAARALAETFGGDTGAPEWCHFGRLAGFTNRKEKYLSPDGGYPFVRLHSVAIGHPYPAVSGLLYRIQEAFQAEPARRFQKSHPEAGGQLLTIEIFRSNPEYAGDGNRFDLAYAVYALSHGISEDAVATLINTRDLSKKGSLDRQRDYTQWTIAKAMTQFGRLGGRWTNSVDSVAWSKTGRRSVFRPILEVWRFYISGVGCITFEPPGVGWEWQTVLIVKRIETFGRCARSRPFPVSRAMQSPMASGTRPSTPLGGLRCQCFCPA